MNKPTFLNDRNAFDFGSQLNFDFGLKKTK